METRTLRDSDPAYAGQQEERTMNNVCGLNILDNVPICDGCMNGVGEECHSPGCMLWLRRCPDIEIRTALKMLGAKRVRYDANVPPGGSEHYRCEHRNVTPIESRCPETLVERSKAWVAAEDWIVNHQPPANSEPDPDAVRDLAEIILKGGMD